MNTVIIGAPLSGKTTCMRSLARALGGVLKARSIRSPTHPGGHERALGFSVRRGTVDHAFWTLPANVWAKESWDELVVEAQHVILVLDGHAVREPQNAEAVARLKPASPFPHGGCVVITKLDVVPVPEAWRQRDRLLRGTEHASWPTFVHTAATSDHVRARDLVPGC